MRRTRIAAAAVLLAVGGAAWAHGDGDAKLRAQVVKEQKPWGIAADRDAAVRTIEVTMSDRMRFVPQRIVVMQGETVRFAVKNAGHMLHELVIGTKKELDAHAALMAKFPNMEHDEPYMTHVKPGATGEIVWTFNRPGTFAFACLVAGHYQAGMKGTLVVTRGSAR